jgi:FAD/FMN-containing dehydrogenase
MKPGVIQVTGLDGGRVSLAAAHLDDLGARVSGPLLRPGDDGWDAAVQVWNGMVATTPALVVQPTTAQEVAATVRFAGEHRLLLSVKGGGHNIAGTSLAEDGLTLDLSRMRQVAVDPAAKLARVGAGCLLSDVDRATQQ